MDSIEPPSFSLGFDLDAAPAPELGSYQNPYSTGDSEDEPGLIVSDSDPDFTSPVLKRLRRGINTEKCSAKDDRSVGNELLGCKEDREDDDIEEFSSPEKVPADPPAPASTRNHFSSCSSKVPLRGSGVLSSQPSLSRGKRNQLDVPASNSSGITSVASLFQRSTRSPLRRFQLLDSDSEDDHPPVRKNLNGVTKKNDSSSKDLLSVANKPKRKESGSMSCTKDLWKDFSPAVSKIQTPALDDVCQDYFSSISMSNTDRKQSGAVASSSNRGYDNLAGSQQTGKFLDSSQPSPPSHRFFLHSDPRIRNLTRQRLPNFLPLGIANDRETHGEEVLVDYMNQFGSKGSSKPGESSSKRRQTKSAAPKDAGKRRVSANSGSAGHWFTSPEGRKVYISRTGQEFSGQSAYRCYKKESGGGFKKSKRKPHPKKKGKN